MMDEFFIRFNFALDINAVFIFHVALMSRSVECHGIILQPITEGVLRTYQYYLYILIKV